jgi:hypothetical protein
MVAVDPLEVFSCVITAVPLEVSMTEVVSVSEQVYPDGVVTCS